MIFLKLVEIKLKNELQIVFLLRDATIAYIMKRIISFISSIKTRMTERMTQIFPHTYTPIKESNSF